MQKLMVCAWALLMVAVRSTSAFASESVWDGTWKLNSAKSQTAGNTFEITETPTGGFHYTDGGPFSYDYACDGKFYATLADRTMSCTGSAATGWDETYKAGDSVLGTSHNTLSGDGKTLTEEASYQRPDGSTVKETSTYIRMSGSNGLVGKWKDLKDQSTSATEMTVSVADGVMHVQVPTFKETYDAKLDGTATAIMGPQIPAGATVSMTQDGPMKVHFVDKLNGKPLWEGMESVSADGKTLIFERWAIGKISEKAVLVYEKQ